jgi:hemerythrin-like domain-containing protein
MSTSAAPAHATLSDTATPDGFELLDVCHRQTLFTLGKLAALVSRLSTRGADPDARTMAADVVRHFATTSRSHHEDEERHVFPKLLAGGDAEIVAAVLRLQQDHGWLAEDWRELAPQLEAIAEGQGGVDFDVLREMVAVFTALSHDHMALEESLIYPQARSRLTALERRDIGRQMAARRRGR